MPQIPDPVISISLLDTVDGHAVQTWEFDGPSMIRIGRAETNDVVIRDTLVSRTHAELTRTDDVWSVTALGRNGIAIGGRAIAGPTSVGHGTVLRLANSGPYLEFRVGRRRNTLTERLADQQRWETTAHEREEERQHAGRVDATEVDFPKRPEQRTPAD